MRNFRDVCQQCPDRPSILRHSGEAVRLLEQRRWDELRSECEALRADLATRDETIGKLWRGIIPAMEVALSAVKSNDMAQLARVTNLTRARDLPALMRELGVDDEENADDGA